MFCLIGENERLFSAKLFDNSSSKHYTQTFVSRYIIANSCMVRNYIVLITVGTIYVIA